MPDFSKDWHVIKTVRFKESYVKAQIVETTGAETYLPMVKIPKHRLRTGQAQFEPLFPSYLFACLDLSTHLFVLRRLHAFQSIVCFDGKPARVDDELIEDLRRRERGRGYINLHSPKHSFHPNQSLRVVDGPFSGQHGLFVRYHSRFGEQDSTQRVCILLDILKTSMRLELPIHSVAPVTGAA
jgi:transcriptional antiterminator RfaH